MDTTSTGGPRRHADGATLARALGWFSVGLGLTQLTVPRAFSQAIGLRGNGRMMSLLGLREIATGVGLLRRRRPGWLWARVGGDAMDLTLLGTALLRPRTARGRAAAATAAVLGVTAFDVLGARRLGRDGAAEAGRQRRPVRKSITVNALPAACYARWRDFESLPTFMRTIESVEVRDQRRSHWVVQGPAGARVAWEVEITQDEPNERIAWRTVGGPAPHEGTVRFEQAPAGRGTIVCVELTYELPGGIAGAVFAKLFGSEPGQQTVEDMRCFKQLVELGEIPTTAGQPSGRRGPVTRAILKASGE